MFTLSGSKHALFALTTYPAKLNTLSDGTDVAETQRYFHVKHMELFTSYLSGDGYHQCMDCIGVTCHLECRLLACMVCMVMVCRLAVLAPSCGYSSPHNMHTSIGI